MLDASSLAVFFRVGGVQNCESLDRLQDAPRDQVSVADLGAPLEVTVQVDDPAVLVDDLDRNDALRCGHRDRQAGSHVVDDACGGTAQRHHFIVRAGLDWRR